MNKNDIEIGKEFAFRDNIRQHEPPLRVEALLATRAGHFKVRFLDGDDAGVEQQVKATNLVWPWKENKKRLRDEGNRDSLLRFVNENWPGGKDPVVSAVQTIFDSCGEGVWLQQGVCSIAPDVLERLTHRAGMAVPELRYPAYKGLDSQLHYPWTVGLELAKGLCAKEPTAVLLPIEQAEREWDVQARQPGGSYLVGLINEYRPVHALIRQWASYDSAMAGKDLEIKRLREILERTIWDLRGKGEDRLAAKLERSLQGQ